MSEWYTAKIDEISGLLHVVVIAEQVTRRFFGEDVESDIVRKC